jgi:hypothetical protein
MKTYFNFNFKITLMCLGLFNSCQKTTNLELTPIRSVQQLTPTENINTFQSDADFRKIRRTPYTFEIKSSQNKWKGVYSLPEGFSFLYTKLISTLSDELFLLGILTDISRNQNHIVAIKFDSEGDMEWNTLFETTGNPKIEHALEDSGDLYFMSEAIENSGSILFSITRIEYTGEFGYSRHFMQSTEYPKVNNLIKTNDQLKIEIDLDNQISNIYLNIKDGAIFNSDFTPNAHTNISKKSSQTQFVQRSIPIRKLIEGKYHPISHIQTLIASLD